MATRTAVFVGALGLTLVACSPPGEAAHRPLAAFPFDTSPQEWLLSADTGTAEPVFESTGVDPGGYIAGDDEAVGETWYFRAPDSVLAQLPAAADGSISYSLKQSSIDAGFPDDDVIIVGPAGRLSYRFAAAPGTTWTRFSVRLSAAAGWRWNWNAPATEEQIRSVLADPARLEIRGEYRTGPDVGGLDNFVLTAAR